MLLITFAAVLLLYALLVLGLLVAGRRGDARAWARFVPDCLVLFKRLVCDRRVSLPRKALVLALIAYLAMPIDLVPDFIPIAGQLDDAIIVAVVLRLLLRGSAPELVREHWPGPPSSLRAMLRLAGTRASR